MPPALVEINNQHWYKLETGQIVPSVTTILSAYPKGQGFAKWLANQGGFEEAENVKNAAADRGSRVHKGIDLMLAGNTLERGQHINGSPTTTEEWKMLMSAVSWFEEEKPTVLRNEAPVWSNLYGYAGTMDLYCKFGDVYTIVDFKTSSAIHKSYRLQLQAYAHALLEMGEQVDQVMIVRLGSKHKCGYEILGEEVREDLFSLFLDTKNIWEFENPRQASAILPSLPHTLSLHALLHERQDDGRSPEATPPLVSTDEL